ncbi:MAG: hypothetical protein EXR93_10075 [Gemmatimonadetes bacterium]|nr:hypothetical protein [Gemmatimonadota bacterium]
MQILRGFLFSAGVLAASLLGACDSSLNLPEASATNVVDTIELFALRGTPVAKPSGFHLPTRSVVRTDQPGFDIAFDIDDAGIPRIYPAGALGLPPEPGVLAVSSTFDAIHSAPDVNYLDDEGLAIPVGTVFVAQSGLYGGDCGITGSLPRYGKFHVLSVNTAERSIKIEALVNINCGYRDLRPGLPTA